MAFRKRNIGIGRVPAGSDALSPAATPSSTPTTVPGIRPSPVDGRPTTSTGTPSLDGILAGHAGFALGSSLLIEESGTTDFSGALLKYYAAEGIIQGHKVHVVGLGEPWGRELPGLVGVADGESDAAASTGKSKERMKIAWRYERLGEFEAEKRIGGARGPAERDQQGGSAASPASADATGPPPFCHKFDLAKRLEFPAGTLINYIPLPPPHQQTSPFDPVLQNLATQLASSSPTTIHRLLVPSLLSPALYPPHSSQPSFLLQFLHALRALLRKYPNRLTAMLSLPLELYPRSSGLVRWAELLSDGVLELQPFPHLMDTYGDLASSGAATATEERPQGMLRVHRLPVFHERGGGGGGVAGVGDDLAFTLSRRKFVIKPFSLPPVEGDTEAQGALGTEGGGGGKQTKVDIDF
ncbi:Elongator complex protein 4 [Macrophomina phaseolina MS6]|uniref:Elongator complex protein 4 n=1 Tax=Macrophomina phaseolina (strain MS6) TaxID=1126212 RepID=K2RFZ5_MACPH|nr:Elongator complex protein 4 [Macrophomina phaseolina MS6]